MGKQYAERDAMALDMAGNYYCRHVGAMTEEGLHAKSDIAAELAWRDMEIDRLRHANRKMKSLIDEVIRADWRTNDNTLWPRLLAVGRE